MRDFLKLVQERKSSRVAFDPDRPVAETDLRQILEAGRWAPTAHNMQNFEVIVVDDKKILQKIGNIKSSVSAEFIRENLKQLSSSEEELLERKVGILGTTFSPSWRDPAKLDEAIRDIRPAPTSQRIGGSPMLLVVVYDSRKRAPASEGDFLGIISLGCVMENMWLMAQSLGISFQILSALGGGTIGKEIKRILGIPEYMNIAYACRLGYPASPPQAYLRVRRDIEAFTHRNSYDHKRIDMENLDQSRPKAIRSAILPP